MNSNLIRIAILTLCSGIAPLAQAQSGDWYAAGSIVYTDDDGDRYIDDSLSGIQLNVGREFGDYLAVEGILGYSDIEGEVDPVVTVPGEKHLEIGLNLLAYYDREAVFAPYLLGGIGYLNNDIESGSDFGMSFKPGSGGSNATATLGLGFKWKMGQSNFAIRGELRARSVFDDKTLTDRLATLGIQYAFGRSTQKRRVYNASDINKDTDGDSVLDMWDECPDTPAGVDVTARGCEIKDMNRDADGDRVPDSRDECPRTPTGVPVDPKGCSLDSDMDGVTTDKDHCPGSRIGAMVDEFGCEHDADDDGVLDQVDQCPDTRPGAKVDTLGCEHRDVISLPGVNFQSGSDLLTPGAEKLIQEVAATLVEIDYLQIEVVGHTDSQGDAVNNQGLSDRRAKTVFDFLIRYGADENRMTFKGYGESEPIADNSTAQGRAANRRVELRVIRQ